MHGQRFADMPFGQGWGGPGFGRGRGRGRGADAPPVERGEVAGWFAGRLPDGWFTGPVELTIDRDEITVIGTLAEPQAGEGRRCRGADALSAITMALDAVRRKTCE